jgi:hypothetical protein
VLATNLCLVSSSPIPSLLWITMGIACMKMEERFAETHHSFHQQLPQVHITYGFYHTSMFSPSMNWMDICSSRTWCELHQCAHWGSEWRFSFSSPVILVSLLNDWEDTTCGTSFVYCLAIRWKRTTSKL